jgi:hypothetical protein
LKNNLLHALRRFWRILTKYFLIHCNIIE